MHSGVPFAFRHRPLAGLGPGFPVWLDINLSQDGAQTWAAWLREGLLLDERSRSLTARMVTYNAELRVFAAVLVSFDFTDGGAIKVWSRSLSWQR